MFVTVSNPGVINVSWIEKAAPSVGLLQFIRSTPGVLAPLIGQKTESHVDENLEIMKINPMNKTQFDEFFKKLIG